MKVFKILFFLSGMTLLAWSSAHALTVVLPMHLKDLTANAELIFIGTVSDIRSEKEPNKIYTYVTFSDLQLVKGIYLEGTITVRFDGGTVHGETLRIPGMLKFVVGERDLLFLAANFRSVCPIVGWGQGRFKIRWDPVSGQELVFDDANVPVKEIKGHQLTRAESAQVQQGSPGITDTGDVLLDTKDMFVHKAESQKTTMSVREFVSATWKLMGIDKKEE